MKPIDNKPTRHWAITPYASGGAGVSYSAFELVNRETGRAHQLHFVGVGNSIGLSASGTGPDLSYEFFTTKRPVTFADFNGVGARVSSVNAGIVWGYSYTWLTIWPGPAYENDPLAYVSMGGWGPMVPGGSAGVHGVLKVAYGAGDPIGTCPMILEIDLELPPDERLTRIQRTVRETPLVALPADVLFDFDSDRLKPGAVDALRYAEELINTRDRGKVVIEGHTDAMGSDVYNQQLSIRRATAVKNWLVRRKVHGAANFQVKGHGKHRPVAPNQLANGRDNPDGRKKNRRVEILFNY